MVRFAPSQEEDPRPATLAQLFVVVAMILGVLTLAAIFVGSSLASFPSTVFHTSLLDIGNWVDRSGRPTVIRGRVAEKLGFTSVDLRVRELGFRKPSEELTHVCSTTDLLGFEDTIFLALVNESTGDALVWRASRNGDLISTARFENGVATSISNNSAQTAFVAEKEYFL
ncbi:MAG: hypothetical protein H0U23_12525 [Blastocatellia bacterium]|nr:hypothetical protein [Blastocatellia bacterium]